MVVVCVSYPVLAVGLSPVEVRYAQGELKKFDIDGIGEQKSLKGGDVKWKGGASVTREGEGLV